MSAARSTASTSTGTSSSSTRRNASTGGACEPECPVEAIFPEDALPETWEPFVKINYAYPDADPINSLVDEYAREHNARTRRSKHASPSKLLRGPCSMRVLD
jgi:hypothetical protein